MASRIPFFLALEEEVVKAELAGKSIIIELDANAKLGPDFIPGDKHQQSENGRLLADIIERHGLIIGNSLKKCTGLVTRKRVTIDTTEESTIDFIIISEDLVNDVQEIIVDEARNHVLTKIGKNKKVVKVVESDHNPIISKFGIRFRANKAKQKMEIYNLKNKKCQEMFRKETSTIMNNKELSSIFNEAGDINVQAKQFLNKLEDVIHKCFKKIKIKERKDEEKDALFKTWRKLKKESNNNNKGDLRRIEQTIADKYAEEYFNKIKERVGNVDSLDGGLKSESLWNLKKELFPQTRDPPTAMIDPRNGNLLTNEENILDAALYTYKKRLDNKPIKKDLQHIKEDKEVLCEKRLKLASFVKTPPWNMTDLDKILKNLKKNKARDPIGNCNELFRLEVAGDDLKIAILKMSHCLQKHYG